MIFRPASAQRRGAALGEAAEADLTVTFGYEKLGMVFYPGRKLCGEIVIADIGFPAYTKYEGHTYFAYDPEDQNQIPKRRADANKGTYGKILIAAGSEGMCGAAYLSALAAYRMGAGLVKILTVRANVPILQNLLPEAILTPYDPEQAQTDPAGFKSLVEQECGWASAIVLGPGLGKEAHVASLVQNVLLSAYVPIIVDADGLNAVAQHPHLSGYFTENVIVTPHLGEMARLTGRSIEDLKRDLVESAVRYGEEKRRDLRAQGCRDGDGGARWQCVYRRQRLRRDGKGRFRRCADRCDCRASGAGIFRG